MKTFEFSIIASGLDPTADDFEARFYENGCDDALVSFQKGCIVLDFAREAKSLGDAICSALGNVRAGGAHVHRVEPDPLVSLSDIASRADLTRAAISNYHRGERGRDFPPPVARVMSESPLWEWSSVARWLYALGKLSREEALAAEVMRRVNALLQARRRPDSRTLKHQIERYEAALDRNTPSGRPVVRQWQTRRSRRSRRAPGNTTGIYKHDL